MVVLVVVVIGEEVERAVAAPMRLMTQAAPVQQASAILYGLFVSFSLWCAYEALVLLEKASNLKKFRFK